MKKILATILLAIGICHSSTFGQVTFQKYLISNGDQESFKVIKTLDGNYALCGYTKTTTKDALILKLSPSGSIIWSKTLSAIGDQIFQSLIQSSDSGFVACGYTVTSFDKDVFVAKFDKYGNLLWNNTFPNSGDDQYMDLVQASDGDYVCTGYIINSSRDVQIDKFNLNGQLVWSKTFGGGSNDGSFSITKLNNNTIMAACYTYNWGSGLHDAMLINFDNAGSIISEHTLGDYADEGADNICITSNGNIFVTAETHSNSVGADDVNAMELDQNLNIVWSKKYGKPGKLFRSFGGQQTSDGGFIFDIHDYSSSLKDFGLIKTNSFGNILWSKFYGQNNKEEQAYDVIETFDNGYLIVGNSQVSVGNREIFIVKTDSLGNSGSTCYQPPTNIIETNYSPILDFCYPLYNSFAFFNQQTFSTVSLSATDSFLCPLSQPLIINFASSDTSFCEKQSIDFYDMSQNNPTSWFWVFQNGSPSFSTLQNPTNIYYANYGQFDVTLIACNSAGCDTLTKTAFIIEHSQPAIPTVNVSNDTLYCSAAFAYAWYSIQQPTVVLSTNSYFVPSAPGNYYVLISDSNGCQNASAVITTSSIQSVNGDTQWCTVVENADGLYLHFTSANKNKCTINIYDNVGKNIFTRNKFAMQPDETIFIPYQNLIDGIYFLKVQAGDLSYSKKLTRF